MSSRILFQSENLKLIEISYSCAKEYVILSKSGSLKFQHLCSYKLGLSVCLTISYRNYSGLYYLDTNLNTSELKEFCNVLDTILLDLLSTNQFKITVILNKNDYSDTPDLNVNDLVSEEVAHYSDTLDLIKTDLTVNDLENEEVTDHLDTRDLIKTDLNVNDLVSENVTHYSDTLDLTKSDLTNEEVTDYSDMPDLIIDDDEDDIEAITSYDYLPSIV